MLCFDAELKNGCFDIDLCYNSDEKNCICSLCYPLVSLIVLHYLTFVFGFFAVLWPLHVYQQRHPLNFVFLGLFTLSLSVTVGVAVANTDGEFHYSYVVNVLVLCYNLLSVRFCFELTL